MCVCVCVHAFVSVCTCMCACMRACVRVLCACVFFWFYSSLATFVKYCRSAAIDLLIDGLLKDLVGQDERICDISALGKSLGWVNLWYC